MNDVGAAQLAAELGASSADHLARVSDAGLQALAASATVAVLLPGSALCVGYDPPSGRRAIDAGVAVALGTDHNPGTSPIEGMATAIALGAYMCGLTPAEAITAATVNSAYALGRGSIAGTLEPGKRADLLELDTDDERDVVYQMGRWLVRRVWASGRLVAGRALEST